MILELSVSEPNTSVTMRSKQRRVYAYPPRGVAGAIVHDA